MKESDTLSVAGALVGALAGLAAELAIEELTGIEIMSGLLEVIGAGFGLIRIDRKIYDATVNLLGTVPVDEADDYRSVLTHIDEMTVDLPELRESFIRLVKAGAKAKMA